MEHIEERTAATENMLSEQELDKLIEATLEREMLMEQITTTVMSDVKRSARRAWLRKWARIAAFSFGLPLVMLSFAIGINHVFATVEMKPAVVIGLGLSVLTMLIFAFQAINSFSPDEV